jgi:DNA primase
MRLTQAGVPAVVALLGTQLSQTHLAWLPQDSTIVLMLDGDHAGRTAASTIQQRLATTGRKTAILHLPDGCEPEDLTDSQLAARARQFLPFF